MTRLNLFKSFGYFLIFAELSFFLVKRLNAETNAAQICVNPNGKSIVTCDTPTFSHFLFTSRVYIDKTTLITQFATAEEILERNVHLLSFPRRFGKSLNLQMVRFFFEMEFYPNGSIVPQCATRSYNFFKSGIVLDKNYKKICTFTPPPLISNPVYEGIVRKHLAQYPVIYVEFKGLEFYSLDTLEMFLSNFQTKIKNAFRIHEYLLNDLNEEQWLKFNNILRNKKPADYDDLLDSIHFLSEILYKKFSKEVIIIIDEYDIILCRLYLQGSTFHNPTEKMRVQEFYFKFLKRILLDGKEFYIQCYMTGIMKLKNAGIFSDLNFLQYYTSSTPIINQYYGISREEAGMLFDLYNLTQENRTMIQDFYDGYAFPTGTGEYKHYYNVFSLTNYLNNLPRSQSPKGYWSESGSMDKYLKALMTAPLMKRRLQNVLLTDSTCLEISSSYWDYLTFTLEDLEMMEKMLQNPESVSEGALTTHLPRFLLTTGYLTLDRGSSSCFKYPNEEVKYYVATIFEQYYRITFTYSERSNLVQTFHDFLFDNETKSAEFEAAFQDFVVKNKARLIPHRSPSKTSKTATTGSDTVLTSDEIEVNEAFFGEILGIALIGAKIYKLGEGQFKHVAFEKRDANGCKADVYAHNGKRQVVVEMKYKPSRGITVTEALQQARKYRTEFKYPYKYIGIMGYANGTIETAAEFDWTASKTQPLTSPTTPSSHVNT